MNLQQKQIWKRDPVTCPGDGWVWVETHQRKSRMGKDYVVDGYWRAPRKPRTTNDEWVAIACGECLDSCEETKTTPPCQGTTLTVLGERVNPYC